MEVIYKVLVFWNESMIIKYSILTFLTSWTFLFMVNRDIEQNKFEGE